MSLFKLWLPLLVFSVLTLPINSSPSETLSLSESPSLPLFDSFHHGSWQELVLDAPHANWYFIPEGKKQMIPIQFGKGISNIVPWSQPCCNGEYVGYVNTNTLFVGKDLDVAQVGILFPPTGGDILGLDINGRKLKITKKDYSISGPIVTLSKHELRSKSLEVRMKINSSRDYHAGMWDGKPILGRMNDLIEQQQKKFITNSIVPIGYAITCCAIGLFFFLIILASGSKESIGFDFMWLLLAWGVFYLFLSGQMRLWFPDFGCFFYFPARTLAALATIRLITSFGGVSSKRITQICWGVFGLIGIQIVASWLGYIWIQQVTPGLLLIPMLFVIYTLHLNTNNSKVNSTIKNIVLMVSILEFTCFLLDTVKIYSITFNFPYPFPFFERHMAILLIVTALIYIVFQVAQDVKSRVRNEAFEEAASQFVHDIQSPVAALRLASRSIEQTNTNNNTTSSAGSNDALVIISSAIRRLNDISLSLKVFLRQKQPTKVQPLKSLVDAIIREKRVHLHFNETIDFETEYEDSAKNTHVRIQTVEFERLLSNLLNNAAEAMDQGGIIKVALSLKDEDTVLEITDQGRGIPPDLLSKLGNRGVTFGKPLGTGLGLFHAKKSIENWGGKLEVHSTLGSGTKVLISLPVASINT